MTWGGWYTRYNLITCEETSQIMKKNSNAKNIKALLKPSIKTPKVLEKLTDKRSPKNKRRQDVKLHQHLLARFATKNEARARKKAEYLATLPKGRVKRILYRMHPKRVARFVFSREGLIMGAKVLGTMVLLGAVASFVTFAYFRKDLPKNITDLKACSQGQKTSYYDRTGEILLWRGEGDVDCRPVALADMNEYLKEAVLASEDQKFYEHPGFDVRGTMRAALSNASSGSTQGGSTLTQQYVKLAVLNNNEQRLSRKIKELILSIELERTYEKNEILQAYLNEISFGSVYNGAEAAAQGFFEKSAKDLTLDEAATFAAAIQAPGTYWEPENQAALIERRDNYVLENMVGQGFITREEAEAAKKVDTIAKLSKSRNKYKDIKAPHFVIEVQSRLEKEFGEKNIRSQGYKVITTLDMQKQTWAEEAVREGIPKLESLNFDNAALVSEEVSTGQVVAYVGSRDFNYGDFGQKNIAGTPRAPGSSVKIYDYAALMKSSENWGAGSIMYDWVTQLPGWPANDPLTNFGDNKGNGPSSIRYLLGNSKNITAAKAVYIAGIPAMHDLYKKVGGATGFVNCSVPCEQVLSTSLGDGGEIRLDEHTHGYATFSRGGKYIPQQFVLKILDAKGKVIRDNTKEPISEQVLDPQIAYIMNDILSDGNASFFRNAGRAAFQLNGYQDHTIPTAIKTGTTNDAENGWMMGHTPEYATGVWIGHHENKSTNGARMEELSGPIWGGYMRRVYEGRAVPPKWQKPEGIKTVAHSNEFFSIVKGACSGSRSCNYGQSDIYPSWYTVKKSSNSQTKVVIDTVSGKRATDCTPQRARKEITGGGIIVPELDPSDPYYKQFMAPVIQRLKSATGEAIPAETEVDDVHSCSDVKPSVTISMPATCNGSCTITANVSAGTKTLRNLYFKMDGTTMAGGSYDISSSGSYNFSLIPDTSGAREFSVEVVDEALYDATASTSSTLTAVPFNFDSASSAGANVKLTWDDLSSPGVTYSLNSSGGGNGLSLGCTPVGSKCTANVPKATLGASGTYTLSIASSSPSRTTNSVNFSY
jgi:membrane peptidoglycan carboxypeptidase